MKPSYINYHQAKWKNAKTHSRSLTHDAEEPILPGLGDVTEQRFDPPPVPQQRYGAFSEREQLKKLGVGDVHATLAIPYLYFFPRTSDADAQGIQIIVSAIQRGLRVPETGILNQRTIDKLARVSGPTWFDKSWNALIGDILTKPIPMGGYVTVGDDQGGPGKLIALGIVGLAAWFIFKGKK